MKRFPTDEAGRLKVILTSWIDQNKRHSEKFDRWKEKTPDAEKPAPYMLASEAVTQIQEAGEQLVKALMALQDK